ncbi:MAG: hypothetical protein AB1631_12770 [Acidobacteriota bacterium]
MENKQSQKWTDRFVELQIRDLRGERLTDQERAFLALVEMTGQTLGGALENEILKCGLEQARSAYRIAASTAETSIHREVLKAIEEGKTEVTLEAERGPLSVLRIHAQENLVEPLFHEGFTFIIERTGFGEEPLGRYGGVFIAVDDLKKMEMTFDADSKTIRLREK